MVDRKQAKIGPAIYCYSILALGATFIVLRAIKELGRCQRRREKW